MGLVRPRSGEVRFNDRPLAGREPFEIARMGVGYVAEDRRLFTELTVAENLMVGRRAGDWSEERILDLFPSLKAMRSRPAGRMSGGEQQMLAIARTLMGNPAALLLDEPSEGLAPKVVEDVARAVLELKQAGLAILLSEQNYAFAGRVGDRAYLLAQGQVRASGTVAEMRDNPL